MSGPFPDENPGSVPVNQPPGVNHSGEASGVKGPDSSAVEHVLGKNGVGGSIPPLGSSATNRRGRRGRTPVQRR